MKRMKVEQQWVIIRTWFDMRAGMNGEVEGYYEKGNSECCCGRNVSHADVRNIIVQ